MTEHLLEMAKALVKVKDGEVTVVSEPRIKTCPLRRDLYGCQEESKETVRRVLESHIQDYGMYSSPRKLELEEEPVSFGASEIVADAIREGLVDAAVVVCEGVGTVVVTKPQVLQAVGAHMTGLIRTEPIAETREGLERLGSVALGDNCEIDQVKGFGKAFKLGYRKVAVTITGHRDFEARQLWEMGKVCGHPPIILAVHNTSIKEEQAGVLSEYADLIWGCASQAVRRVAGKEAKIQIGVGIPVFAMTEVGKRLVLNRALHYQGPLVIHRANLPHLEEKKQPEPLL